jgi:hypothetical protein
LFNDINWIGVPPSSILLFEGSTLSGLTLYVAKPAVSMTNYYPVLLRF